MKAPKKILTIITVLILVAPLSAGAFWSWNKNKAKTEPIKNKIMETNSIPQKAQSEDLSNSGKILATNKYRLFEESFERGDVEKIITNRDNFWFTITELNYLFSSVNTKVKKPFLKNLQLESEGAYLKVSADFQKFIKGRASFNVSLASRGERLSLEIDKARLYGLPVPSRLISNPLNKALDDYFKFLYEDERYQGYDFSMKDETLKLNLRFR